MFTTESLAAITFHKLGASHKLTIDADEKQYSPVLAHMIEQVTTKEQRFFFGGDVAGKLAELIFSIWSRKAGGGASRPATRPVVSQQMVCDAIRRFSKEKLNGDKRHDDVECPEVDPHPELEEAVALTKAGLGRSRILRSVQKQKPLKSDKPAAAGGGGAAAATATATETEAAKATETVTLFAWLQRTAAKVAFWFATASWVVKLVVYGVAYLALGATALSAIVAVAKAVMFVWRWIAWAVRKALHALKSFWNLVMARPKLSTAEHSSCQCVAALPPPQLWTAMLIPARMLLCTIPTAGLLRQQEGQVRGNAGPERVRVRAGARPRGGRQGGRGDGRRVEARAARRRAVRRAHPAEPGRAAPRSRGRRGPRAGRPCERRRRPH